MVFSCFLYQNVNQRVTSLSPFPYDTMLLGAGRKMFEYAENLRNLREEIQNQYRFNVLRRFKLTHQRMTPIRISIDRIYHLLEDS